MRQPRRYYVYVMGSLSGTLYVGFTGNLHKCVFEHKVHRIEGFTSRYDVGRLLYWESFDDVHKAIGREKQLKGWRRLKKIWLIQTMNPHWIDLSSEWYPWMKAGPMLQILKDQLRPETPGTSTRVPPSAAEGVGTPAQASTIGPTVHIKGEIQGSEALYVEGTIEGRLECPAHRVTVGRKGKIVANVNASQIVVMGSLRGDVACSDFAEVRNEASLIGDLVARRIRVEEGAVLKGRVETRNQPQESQAQESARLSPDNPPKAAIPQQQANPTRSPEASKPGRSGEVHGVNGSSVLLIPGK